MANALKAASFCRDTDTDFTNLSVIVSEQSGQTLVSLEQYTQKTMHSCADSTRASARHSPHGLIVRLPILDLPDDVKASNVVLGVNGDVVSSRVDISISISREELVSYFGDQIRDQNWVFQAGWSSNLSWGSVWAQNTSDDGILIGTLHVYDAGTDPIRVRFSIDPADPTKDIDHGNWLATSTGCN